MAERKYSRYTRANTWAALYNQHIEAGYALVPYSATNNSIAVIRCKSPEETQSLSRELLKHAKDCMDYYSSKQTPDKAPEIIQKAAHAVVLAKSSEYHHYHLGEYTEFRIVICGLHDSYLQLPVWEMKTNKRYNARETAISITLPEFESVRCSQFGHNILLGAIICGNKDALQYLELLPPRTQRRLRHEAAEIQSDRYQGRPLAFYTDARRKEISSKISKSLKAYYARKHQGVS